MKIYSVLFIILLIMIVVGSHYHYTSPDRTLPKYRLMMAIVIYPSICIFVAFVIFVFLGK